MNIPRDKIYTYDMENGDYMIDPLENEIASKPSQNKIICPYPNEEEENTRFMDEDNNDIEYIEYEEYGGSD